MEGSVRRAAHASKTGDHRSQGLTSMARDSCTVVASFRLIFGELALSASGALD